MQLPEFRYHPDPIATGCVVASDQTCAVCRKMRGYIAHCPIYASKSDSLQVCPWCIADGTAHETLGVMFFDDMGVGGGGQGGPVSQAITDEIVFRTPGFFGWQQERWFTHCEDAAAFLGRVGFEELKVFGLEAIEAILDDAGLYDEDNEDEWKDFFESLDKDGSPTAYLFRCLHCGEYGGYTDCD